MAKKKAKKQPIVPPTDRPWILCVIDFWDRSPCPWFCDYNKLDQNDPVQKAYAQMLLDAVQESEVVEDHKIFPRPTYVYGSADDSTASKKHKWTEEVSRQFGGRPDEVEHAHVLPPCLVEHIVMIHYE